MVLPFGHATCNWAPPLANAVSNLVRLMRAGITLAQHGVRFVPKGTTVPPVLHFARLATLPVRIVTWPLRLGTPREQRVAGAARVVLGRPRGRRERREREQKSQNRCSSQHASTSSARVRLGKRQHSA